MIKKLSLVMVCATAAAVSINSQAQQDHGRVVGNVYTMTNSEDGNRVVIYNRFRDGSIRRAGTARTLGQGGNNEVAVDPLGSQNSILISDNGRFLFAVNAGSNDISAFRILGQGRLRLVDRISSKGESPVSLAMDGNERLFVLNSRGTGSIASFDVDRRGRLSPVPNGVVDLGLSPENVADMNVAPGQIALDNLNRRVLLTNGGQGTLTSFPLDDSGRITGEETVTELSTGLPFTVALTRFGHVLIAQAGNVDDGFQFGTGAVSSVDLDPAFSTGNQVISDSVGNGQSATCWVVTDGQRFAYTANTFSDTVSSYSFDRDGELTLVDGEAGYTNDGPLDLGLSRDGRFLYVLNAGDGSTPAGPNDNASENEGGNISAFRVNQETGALIPLGTFANRLPAAASLQGIAVR